MISSMSFFGADDSNSAVNPYLTAPHALHHGGRMARNPIELAARSLPRPRKRKNRKNREQEKSLYPSVAAVEEAVPEAIISVQDNGTLCIRLPGGEGANEYAMEEVDLTAPATRRLSNPSSSEKLDQAFRKLSVKRKPVASTPWPMDSEGNDDPLRLGGTALTLAPRRKVFRHASCDSQTSGDSGDSSSVSNSSGSTNNGHLDQSRERRIESNLDFKPTTAAAATAANPTVEVKKRRGRRQSKSLGPRHDDLDDDAIPAVPQKRGARKVEIEPGLFLPLRSRDETLAAAKTGFVEEIFCQGCDVELICITDASFCLCPECKCISPVDGIANCVPPTRSNSNRATGSVARGLKASALR